jgi:hypothetical protein
MQQPKEDNFDNAFKEAFEKASLAPPDIIWNNIESNLPLEVPISIAPAAESISITSKLLLGTGVVLISVLSYLNFKDSSEKNIKPNLNPTTNENIVSKLTMPAVLEPKVEFKKLATNLTYAPKIKIISKPFIAEVLPTDITIPDKAENELIILPKIEEKTIELASKGVKLPKIVLEMPNLVPNNDSQIVAPYYDPNALQTPQNNKGKFWQNFKISGGIRVSN